MLSFTKAWAGEYTIALTTTEEAMILEVNKVTAKKWVELLKARGLQDVQTRHIRMLMDNALRKRQREVPLTKAEQSKLKAVLGIK